MELKIYNYQGVVNEDYNVANTPAPPGKVIYSLFCFFGFNQNSYNLIKVRPIKVS